MWGDRRVVERCNSTLLLERIGAMSRATDISPTAGGAMLQAWIPPPAWPGG
jgi:hypothetical protein